MKTILVDAINGLVSEDGDIFFAMQQMLDQYPNQKIILTGADDEGFKKYGLDKMPYQVFTLKHNPEKANPEYFKKFLSDFNLSKNDVVYFEHNKDAVRSAESIGILTYFYDHNQKDLEKLKAFLDTNL